MSVKIRLQRFGKKDQPFFRIVVMEKSFKRNGKVVDNLGIYDPKVNPHLFKIDKIKLEKWLSYGAIPTESTRKLLKL